MKLIALVGILLLPAVMYAQSYDERLLKSYDASVLNELENNDPNKITLLNYAVDNGAYVTENGNSKGMSLPEIELQAETMSFVDLGIQITDQNQYFQVKGDNRIYVVKSFWVLKNELETK